MALSTATTVATVYLRSIITVAAPSALAIMVVAMHMMSESAITGELCLC